MPDEISIGTLKVFTVRNGPQLRLAYTNRNGKPQEPVVVDFFAGQNVSLFDGKQARFVLNDGQVQKIQVEGEDKWREKQIALQGGRSFQSGQRRPTPIPSTTPVPNNGESSMFHNPYNFIPALPREDIPDGNDLKDAPPKGHDRYHPDHWSGRIRVKMTTVTPLLLPDAAGMVETENDPPGNSPANTPRKGHKTYPVRVDGAGMPLVASTGIKGMLRAAYEAVTNSRMGVFAGHEERLALRPPAQGGSQVVPARVDGNTIHLLPGTTSIGNDGTANGPMYAAWLPQYRGKSLQPGSVNPIHLKPFWAEIEQCDHYYKKRDSIIWSINFQFWQVLKLHADSTAQPAITCNASPNKAQPTVPSDQPGSYSTPSSMHGGGRVPLKMVHGYVLITKRNMPKKHDERFFFVGCGHSQNTHLDVPLTPTLREKWCQLIKNYQEQHEKEIKGGQTAPPQMANNCGGCQFSSHIPINERNLKLRDLPDNTLCYAKVQGTPGQPGFAVTDLYPVMISRDLYNLPPSDLLDDSLRPAKEMSQLSPADRVFGWVRQKGAGAFKGQLRVGPVTCNAPNPKAAIQPFDGNGFPLAILGQPKPEQVRFYGAADKNGTPFANKPKKEGYATKEQGLRGRKVYLHQPLLINPHQATLTCRRREDQRDNQNRSLNGWVKERVTFHFDLHVSNLSTVELGALLWLLKLPDNHHHRLGGGKPLGFGSVRLEIDTIDLANGQWWKAYYASLEPPKDDVNDGRKHLTEAQAPDPGDMIQAFRTAVERAFEKPFDNVRFIKAFCHAARGFTNYRTHYPRTDGQKIQQDEGFAWFVANEKGEKYPLSALYEDPVSALPRNP